MMVALQERFLRARLDIKQSIPNDSASLGDANYDILSEFKKLAVLEGADPREKTIQIVLHSVWIRVDLHHLFAYQQRPRRCLGQYPCGLKMYYRHATQLLVKMESRHTS